MCDLLVTTRHYCKVRDYTLNFCVNNYTAYIFDHNIPSENQMHDKPHQIQYAKCEQVFTYQYSETLYGFPIPQKDEGGEINFCIQNNFSGRRVFARTYQTSVMKLF